MTINTLTREDVKAFRDGVSEPTPNALNAYQYLATRSAFYPGKDTPLGLAYVALKMNGEAGEFAEHVGKAMRDDRYGQPVQHLEHAFHETLTPSRHELLVKEIGDVLWYLSAACNELGVTLSEAAALNLEKLADRSERNVLQGSGDNR